MTILVTGATGNVGRYVVKHLVASGHSGRALSRNPEKANPPAQAYTVTSTVEQLTGRPPLTLQDFIKEHASRYRASSRARAGC